MVMVLSGCAALHWKAGPNLEVGTKELQGKVQYYIDKGVAVGEIYVQAGPNDNEVIIKKEYLSFLLSKCITYDFLVEEIKLHPWKTFGQTVSDDLMTFTAGALVLGIVGTAAIVGY
jgi:hypothetical protein